MAGEPTITLDGRLGSDPDLKFLDSGRSVCSFSVAVTPRNKINDNWTDGETMWFRVSLWRNTEEFLETATKGQLVKVTGRFVVRTYKAKTGEDKTSMEIEADSVGIIPVKSRSEQTTLQAQDAPF